jgi:hypothetical protein
MSLSTPTTQLTETPHLPLPNLTQFEIEALRKEQEKLKFYTDKTQEEQNQVQEQAIFLNLSLIKLFQNLSRVIIDIINELIAVTPETQFNDILMIFIKDDRLVYEGILLVMIAIGLFLIDVTS